MTPENSLSRSVSGFDPRCNVRQKKPSQSAARIWQDAAKCDVDAIKDP